MPAEERMTKKPTMPVTARALIQRINRKLTAEGQRLKAPRGRPHGGDYFIVHVTRHAVTRTDVDLEALGRELGALQPWERLQS